MTKAHHFTASLLLRLHSIKSRENLLAGAHVVKTHIEMFSRSAITSIYLDKFKIGRGRKIGRRDGNFYPDLKAENILCKPSPMK